jgi:hypothetical protein
MPMELILNKKKGMCFLMWLRFKKKSVLKLLNRTVYLLYFNLYGLNYHYRWYPYPTALYRVVAKEHGTFKTGQKTNSRI